MKGEETRRRIVVAALELFSERSYHDVSMEEIARRAGISKGGLFHHFPSKYELAKEALFYGLEVWGREVISKIQPLESAEERLWAIIDASFDFVIHSLKFSRFFLEVYEESLKQKNGPDIWKAFGSEYLGILEDIFREIGAENPRARAFLLGALVDGFALDYLIFRDEVSVEEAKKEAFRIFTCTKRS
ncbi:TetR/AcrR family transcriptional regulator [Thermococcus sp. 21S7]|uniref:TetR/AcrR family transcriptional regulator n=1 Tax=Thermococcus sp. 21S7 TaxID=1638221 RepID=UPI00143B44DA|nr:TetR/AcrR family transcriptional regulator [Thermococcus sp. 21S7]NJE60559.1 TetR family transcriptional regulator [Thermococcus sp. 21S7]